MPENAIATGTGAGRGSVHQPRRCLQPAAGKKPATRSFPGAGGVFSWKAPAAVSGGFCVFPAAGFLDRTPDTRGDRQEHNEQEDCLNVVADEGELPQPGAQQHQARTPHNRADNVEDGEAGEFHARHTGHNRGEGPHNRHEAADNHRDGAVFDEKSVGLFQPGFFEEPGILPGGENLPELVPDEIADLPAQGAGNRYQQGQQPQRGERIRLAGQHAAGKQQRVAGQYRKQHTGFDENNEQNAAQNEITEGAGAGQKVHRVQPLWAGHHHALPGCMGENLLDHAHKGIRRTGTARPGVVTAPPLRDDMPTGRNTGRVGAWTGKTAIVSNVTFCLCGFCVTSSGQVLGLFPGVRG